MATVRVEEALAREPEDVAQALLDLHEDQWFDRKSVRVTPRKLVEAEIGMANAEGGILIVGLSSGRVEGTDADVHARNALIRAAVELAEGQGLKVTAQLLGDRNGPSDAAVLGQLQVYSSLRDRWPPNELEAFDGVSNSAKWSIETPEVGGDGDGSSSDAEFFAQPGTYYFSLRFYRNVGPDRESPIRRREFKSRYNVRVTGVALEPSPTATPTEEEPSPEPTESEDPGGAAGGPSEPASDDTPYVRVYLMTFLIGLLLGFGVVVGRAFAGRSASTRLA